MRQKFYTFNVIAILLLATSCTKDKTTALAPVQYERSLIKQPTNLVENSANTKSLLDAIAVTAALATTYNYTIPLTNLTYYNQFNTGCTNSGYRTGGCLPACCLMGAHLMNTTISVTPAKFTSYCAGMTTSSAGTTIMSAYNYLRYNVFSSQLTNVAQSNTATGKSNTIANIKTYLSSNHPAVALIRYLGGSSKTISTSGTINHFVLIVGLNETSAGVGTIYYIDPNNNAGTKSVSFATFLSSMVTASSSYNYMRIGN